MSLPSTRLGLKGVEPLIVDDNSQSLEVVTAILMGFGINRATKCNSAAEARDVLVSRVFDVVIVDCEMPDEDGFSLVQQIRSDPNGANFTVPILMMSAVTPQSKVEAVVTAEPTSPSPNRFRPRRCSSGCCGSRRASACSFRTKAIRGRIGGSTRCRCRTAYRSAETRTWN